MFNVGADSLETISGKCELCQASADSPNVVVSRGNPFARFMIIGEAPGAKENLLALPFVGRSGQLLDKLISSVGFDCDNDVYITNAVKCRPPKNRRPTKKELEACRPWLAQQILLVDPLIIALVGATAVEAILGKKVALTSIRGKWQNWDDRLVMPIFHPAYLLRNSSQEEGSPMSVTRKDLINIRNRLDMMESGTDMRVLTSDRLIEQ